MTDQPGMPGPDQPEPTQPIPPYGAPQPPQPPYGQQPYGQPQYQQPQYGQPAYGYAAVDPAAPYGRDPRTGWPYSDKSKLVAGLIQLLIPLGIGRMYLGYTGIGIAQLLVTLVTCGLGAIWPFIDGILILVGSVRDPEGRPLRD